jgi:hypothetical protein
MYLMVKIHHTFQQIKQILYKIMAYLN